MKLGGSARIVLVVMISILVVAGTSLAFKKFARGNDPAGLARAGYLKYADYGGAVPSPGSGCGSSGCGVAGASRSSCCSGGGSGGAANVEQIKVAALKYYESKYGDGDVSCEVKDYGCHQEAEIIKNGAVVKKLSISGDRVTEI